MERGAHGLTLSAVNAPARALGLRVGQRHADARAMIPDLGSAPANRAADLGALDALAQWCVRWSPGIAIDACGAGHDGVFMDVGGAAHLFGGEAGLLADIAARFSRAAMPVRAGLADTPGAAWAAARFAGAPARIVPPRAAREVCGDYPLAALRLDAATLARADRLGFKCIGDLYAMPRAGLARRFTDDGLGLVRRLDQLLGDAGEALDTVVPPARYAFVQRFAEPVTDLGGVEAWLPGLLDRLATQLAHAGLGAKHLVLTAFRTDGGTTSLDVRSGRPSRDVAVWARLLHERGLNRLDLGFGIDALRLDAAETEAFDAPAPRLDAPADTGEALGDLVDRLSARLGAAALRVACLRASWLPERAERWAVARDTAVASPALPVLPPRPLILIEPPEPVDTLAEVPHGAPAQFRWRRVVRHVARVEGPERLSPEWWRGTSAARTRDYFRVEVDSGARFWLFREGLYDAEDGADFGDRAPTWWLHGLFA